MDGETQIWMSLGLIVCVGVTGSLLSMRREWINSAPKVDETGPLMCPYCEHAVTGLVHYLGQSVSCPKCHAAFRAPDHRGPTASPEFQAAQEQIVRGVLGIIGSGVLLYFIWQL